MKETWKPGNMLYPLPAVLVSTRGTDGTDNLFTVAWTGTICTNPPMLYISVRKSRFSYKALHETHEFGLNLTTEKLVRAVDYCGVVSGRDHDKFNDCHLTKEKADKINVPLVAESPVTIECRIVEEKELGSHVMMIADVLAVHADTRYMDEKGRFALEMAHPIVYSHGTYFSLEKPLGTFGYSVKKNHHRRSDFYGKKKRQSEK
ncbi:MAG: flavin reductase family protein [Lachnospiraceae bacterium]|uniref:Flavin reductase family protein n=1 Tax=Candidatus Weimeria bifida TaxID=2599074 RepID=A0A6N7IXY2_9FIRM|nr:flavin reductase family protein [Candidatus Weimeria bifida]RRF95119.1 MAG: flavin reductase family protein [Lachnospiraceae bacterium]